jgi:hypothetical protein
MIRFVCGCTAKIDPPIDEKIFSTFDSIVYDSEGFMICLVHRERRSGWRSVPYTALTMPAGVDTADWSPLEYERFRIFNEFPKVRTVNFISTVEDQRDNRNPITVGERHLNLSTVQIKERSKKNGKQIHFDKSWFD